LILLLESADFSFSAAPLLVFDLTRPANSVDA